MRKILFLLLLCAGISNGQVLKPSAGGSGLSSPTPNRILITNGSSPFTILSAGTSGQILQSNGVGVDPSWVTISAGTGTVTSVGLSLPNIFTVSNSPVTSSGTLTAVFASQLQNLVLASPDGVSGTPTFRSLVASDIPSLSYEAPLTFSTGLTRTVNTITVNTSQNISTLSNLTTNGFVKTSGGTGALSIDNSIYLTGNQPITLSGDISGSGATSISTTIGNLAVTNAKIANSTIDLTAKVTGLLPVANGGTGVATLALNGVLYGNAATSVLALAVNSTATNKFLTQSSSNAPAWNILVSGDIPNNAANTTGSAAKWTTARSLGGNSIDGSADVAFANKFIVQGTTDAGLSAAQFLGSLGTGILKNTTTTGVLSIAVAGDFPTLNQSTTGSAATLTTARSIYGNSFNGSADLAQIIASTFGGTGNGFTKFSGPATTEKTFTLPNASATILTDNALVTVAQGGTGAGTLTGILKGNGTSAVTAISLPSDPTQFLNGNGAFSVPSGGTAYYTWNTVAVNTTATSNNGYITNTTGSTVDTITLPSSPTVGDHIAVIGRGTGGWLIKYQSGDSIMYRGVPTTASTGFIQSVNFTDAVELIFTQTHTWTISYLSDRAKTNSATYFGSRSVMFQGSTTATITVPIGSVKYEAWLVGGGGGGGAGRKGAVSTVRCGGGGGAGGGVTYILGDAANLSSTETVTISTVTNGAGGISQTVNSNNGADGANGDTVTFAGMKALGGNGGKGGTATTGTGGVGVKGITMFATASATTGAGGTASTTGGVGNSGTGTTNWQAPGGGTGSGLTNANPGATNSGGAGGDVEDPNANVLVTFGAAGTGVNNNNGVAALTNKIFVPGSGGGGGASSTSGNAQSGGNGGNPGGGGGGGGASLDSVGNSGAGGAGGEAYYKIIFYF